MRKIEVKAIEDGTIEKNLRDLGFSSTLCSRLRKRMGLINLNGQDVKIVDLIKQGSVFTIALEDEKVKEIIKYNIPIKIVYEDEDLAIVDKPSGLAVINTHTHYGKSLENALACIWGNFIYRPVNRLDKDTTGLMIIAKNQLVHSRLGKMHIKRKYLALCDGIFNGEGLINSPISLEENSTMKRCVSIAGKEAITKYKVVKNYSTYTLVELTLETGRTHQIRVHMASIGHPILQDSLYNPNCKERFILDNGFNLITQALHSYYIEFLHPISGNPIKEESTPEFEL